MRRVTAESRGEQSRRDTVVGEGTLTLLPPSDSFSNCSDEDLSEELTLDWDGTLGCDESVTTGGFTVANLRVEVSISSWPL